MEISWTQKDWRWVEPNYEEANFITKKPDIEAREAKQYKRKVSDAESELHFLIEIFIKLVLTFELDSNGFL